MRFTCAEAAKAMNGTILRGDPDLVVTGVSHDSREVGKDDLFFPIIGERFDGHIFIPAAAEGGCRAIVISEEAAADTVPEEVTLILVEDTTEAIYALARAHLAKMDMTVIGVTGSTGKTSTRDMTGKVMATTFKTGVTRGNLNTPLGLSVMVLGFDEDTEVGVLEMGMDHTGEILASQSVARPHVALITNIGATHLEKLGSRDAIYRAKMEIAASLGEEDWLIVNESGEYCNREKTAGVYHLLMTGLYEDCDVRVENVREEKEGCAFTLRDGDDTYEVQLPVPGAHNALNACLALTAGKVMGIPYEKGIEGLRDLELTGSRLKFEEFEGMTLIDDTYNANPDSMKSSIDVLMGREGTRKIAVLSDMRELGPVSEEMHRAIGAYAREKGVARIFGFGPETRYIVEEAGDIAAWYDEEDLAALCDDLAGALRKGDVILFKGSRGMRVERVLEDLRKRKLFG